MGTRLRGRRCDAAGARLRLRARRSTWCILGSILHGRRSTPNIGYLFHVNDVHWINRGPLLFPLWSAQWIAGLKKGMQIIPLWGVYCIHVCHHGCKTFVSTHWTCTTNWLNPLQSIRLTPLPLTWLISHTTSFSSSPLTPHHTSSHTNHLPHNSHHTTHLTHTSTHKLIFHTTHHIHIHTQIIQLVSHTSFVTLHLMQPTCYKSSPSFFSFFFFYPCLPNT